MLTTSETGKTEDRTRTKLIKGNKVIYNQNATEINQGESLGKIKKSANGNLSKKTRSQKGIKRSKIKKVLSLSIKTLDRRRKKTSKT